MRTPFFSIILTTFQRPEFLKLAIKSVLNQDFKNYELIIMDDASDDNTYGVVKKFKDQRIVYIKNKKNIGMPRNLKKSFKLARGKYIFLLSDDDFILRSDTFTKVYQVAMKRKFGFALLGLIFYDTDILKPIFRAKPFYKKTTFIPPTEGILLKTVGWHTDFVSGNIYRKDMIQFKDIIDDVWLAHMIPAVKIMKKTGIVYFGDHYIVGRISPSGNIAYLNIDINKGYHKARLFDMYKKFDKSRKRFDLYKKPHIEDLKKTLPAIKYYTSNGNVIKIARELLNFEPEYKKNILFWTNLFIAIMTPKYILGSFRKVKLYFTHFKIKDLLKEIKYEANVIKIHKYNER